MPPLSDAVDHDAVSGRADLARPLADEIRRDRLIDMLAERWNVRLVTVIAPGGYGKSTALAQAIRDNDTDPSGVDAYTRCRSSQPDASAIARDLLASLGADREVDGGDIDRVVDAVVAAVSDASPNDVCLHIDDVHLAGDIDGAEDFLNGLLADLPFNGHLVLAGRSLPAIRTSRWRAADQVADVDVGQLAFDSGELERLAARHGAHADEAAVADGWPALSRLALMVGSGVAREYLLEEVVEGLSESQRRGVAATVLAGAADDELLAAAGCVERCGQLVEQVPLLVELVDGSIGAHDLWHEVLPSLAGDDELGTIVEAVVTRRSDRGDPIGAVDAALAARRWDLAQHLIGVALTFGDEDLTIGRADRWLSSFPTGERDEPRVRLLRAFRDRMAGDFAGAKAEYFELFDVFAAAGDIENETTVTWELGVLCWLSGDREGYQKVEERSRSIIERGGARMLALSSSGGIARAEMRGDFARALEYYEQIDSIDEVSLRHRSSLSLLVGDSARARQFDALMLRHFPKPIVQGHARFTEWQIGDPAPMLEFRSRRDWDLDNRRNDFLVRVFEAMIGASLGRRPDASEIEVLGWSRARERTFVALVWAAHDLFTGDESAAGKAFEARLADIGVDEPLLRGEVRRFLSYSYVLSPSMREMIEADDSLGPLHQRTLAVARWFVGIRGGDEVGPPPATPPEFLAWLPLPWSVEIAARLAERGDQAGVELAEYLADVCGAASHAELRRVAERAPSLKAGVDAILAVVPAPPSAPARVTVAGATSIDFGDSHEVVTRQRVRQLLQMLVLRPQLTRSDVVDALWPGAEPAKGRSNLRATLLHLRRLLEPGRQAGEAAFHLRQRGERLWLQRSDMLTCDVWDVADALAEADVFAEAGRDDDAIEMYSRAVEMWPNGACADVRDAVQVAGDVEAIDSKVRRAACWVAERLLARGDRNDAVAAATAVLERDEFDERAHGVLIAARLGDDDLAGARGAIDICLARLRELGVRPSSGTAMLVKRYERRSGSDVA